MNYIYEIRAFYDRLETNSLPSPAISLWHALVHIDNKTGWQLEFAVAVSVLEIKTGLNAKAIERARNNLTQAGLIEWRSRKGNQSAVYRMIPLYDKNDMDSVAKPVVQPVAQPVVQPVVQPVAINKQNETKQNKDTIPKSLTNKENYNNSLKEKHFPESVSLKLEEWFQYKKERKESYKPTGLKSFLSEIDNKLKIYREADVVGLIGECMANNWRGIIWDRLKGKEIPEPAQEPAVQAVLPPDLARSKSQHEEAMRRLRGGASSWKDLIAD